MLKKNQRFFSIATSATVITRAIKVALIVGTVLAFINYNEKILSMTLSTKDWLKITTSYLVPYIVSTWSSVSAIKETNK